VVVTTSPGDQAGCRVLHRLESLKINTTDPGQNGVAVVETKLMKAWTKARVASVVRDRRTDRS